MKLKKFYIWDFPEKEVRILLKNYKQFLIECSNKFGSMRELSKFLGLPYYTVSVWKYYNIYMPLWALKKIVKKLKLNKNQLEKRIIAYKGVNTSKPIKNPILPIKENPDLFVLMTHLICDGGINKNGIAYYVNSNKSLIKNFRQILNLNFGKFVVKEYLGRDNVYYLLIPKIISDLLKNFYKVEFDSKKARLPKRIFNLPKDFKISVVRAFIDDEGNVDLNYRIGIYSSNFNLLQDIKKLLCKLNFKSLTLIKKKTGEFYFYIKPKEFEKYGKLIGSNHTIKKELLSKLIKNKLSGFSPGQHRLKDETKDVIYNLLKNKGIVSSTDLVLNLGINKSNVNVHLKKLRENNLIEEKYRKGQTIYWSLKEV